MATDYLKMGVFASFFYENLKIFMQKTCTSTIQTSFK